MCLTYFTVFSKAKPRKFVVAFNREEQCQRETLAFAPYAEDPNIMAGRDMISKGTWLGINIKVGLIVFLTNYDDMVRKVGRSRGQLVYSLLSTKTYQNQQNVDQVIERKLEETLKIQLEFSAFNLVVYNVVTGKALYINSAKQLTKPTMLKEDHHYGLCNIDIDTIWPKTDHGLKMYRDVVQQPDDEVLMKKLLEMMMNSDSFNEDPNAQASIFVKPYLCTLQNAERRTKTTTIIIVGQKMDVKVREVTHEKQGSTVDFVGYFCK